MSINFDRDSLAGKAVIKEALIEARRVQASLGWVTGTEYVDRNGSYHSFVADHVTPGEASRACAIGSLRLGINGLGFQDIRIDNEDLVSVAASLVVDAWNNYQGDNTSKVIEEYVPTFFEDGSPTGNYAFRYTDNPDYKGYASSLPDLNDRIASGKDDVLSAFEWAIDELDED